jgi:hypothetical protein
MDGKLSSTKKYSRPAIVNSVLGRERQMPLKTLAARAIAQDEIPELRDERSLPNWIFNVVVMVEYLFPLCGWYPLRHPSDAGH